VCVAERETGVFGFEKRRDAFGRSLPSIGTDIGFEKSAFGRLVLGPSQLNLRFPPPPFVPGRCFVSEYALSFAVPG
jgi:hypothetical protein